MTQDTFVNRCIKDNFYMAIGARLAALREQSGLGLARVAEASKLTINTIKRAEDGSCCSVLVLARLADAYDCTLDDMVPIGMGL